MVLARAADNFTTGGAANTLVDDGPGNGGATHRVEPAGAAAVGGPAVELDIDDDAARPPYLHVRALRNPHARHVN
jgi:hypothetical protein